MSSRRRECTRRDHPASFGRPCSDGTPFPNEVVSVTHSHVKNLGTSAYIFGGGIALQVRLDGLVLLVEVSQVGDQILDNVGVRQRVDLDIRGRFGGDSAQACQGVLAVDVHGTASTNALSAAPPEGQRRILLVLDLDQGVQDHGAGLVEVDGVGLQPRLLGRGIRVPSVDLE